MSESNDPKGSAPLTVQAAIVAAESLLPGNPAPEGALDPRWQAIIQVGDFIDSNPEEVLEFILRWGRHSDEDLRAAVATCLLEHLLEDHFDHAFPRLAEAVTQSQAFREMCRMGWYNHGDMSDSERKARWLDLLDGGHPAEL